MALALLDTRGRRELMLLSTSLTTLSIALLAASFALQLPTAATIACMCLFMVAFSVGQGPCTWVIISEVFPFRFRSKMTALAVFANRLTSGLVALSFLSLSGAVGSAGAFGAYACVSACHFAFVYSRVPETRGRSLEELERAFESGEAVGAGVFAEEREEHVHTGATRGGGPAKLTEAKSVVLSF